ncbi:MAG TPA: phosphatidylglycerol lysyltransferase domain-containing protein [Pirellulaceae bacterium]|nr:phosphatidylglycerol lysyltransferase domain-containing protein [Pirellulaceae bacterium]HMO90893.1 phosphatidylglycerol lysyltransferase domain-containing protein [Pirellulaceae bacterium]HMP68631.1 phosphatidylglycerol lysyltransferase domain-containing protein [Pirellulaceae bacterium]
MATKSNLHNLTAIQSKQDMSSRQESTGSTENAPGGRPRHLLSKLQQHGNFTLAYGGLVQDCLSYFETDQGYLPYAKKWRYCFALGDPVAPTEHWPKLVDEFIKKFKRPAFVQASEGLAELISQQPKYYVTEFGYDTYLWLKNYDFSGKSKERLRYAWNWLTTRGYRFEEKQGAAIPCDEVQNVSGAWRKTRTIKRREVVFLNRPLVPEHELDVRKFFLYDADNRMVAFAFFDPMYQNGKVMGYTTAIKRRIPDAPVYAETGLVKHAIEQFKTEGIQLVTLGLAPLAGLENRRFRANPLLARSWKYGFNARWLNRFFYNLQGHAQYKNHFYGEKVMTYFCSPGLVEDLRIISLLKLMRVF